MFTKILIANRGEIAVRIMATCREMGICSVAVYSEADRSAQHVLAADEAYLIGPAPAIQSYLNIDAIIRSAQQSGAEAIHPGYGFLSENVAFAEACEKAGIVFIGPPVAAMRLMGAKISAKQVAQTVGAPTVPGYNGESQDDAILQREAERIGLPLLIKASAGGGGKGMRTVYTAQDFLPQLEGARREALSAFGDATVFLERLLLRPRHVEIQVLGDSYGHMIHLGERECSLQRRHQKIIEESPSPVLTPTLRVKMGESAVQIARAAGYVNAGTLEFMLDDEQCFYFLEMNTRLQVEHPVTELVTGLDIVRQQICIAAGEALTLTQEQVSQRGHAIEARLYAEDPEQDFLPSPGTITGLVLPNGPGIRVDSGVSSGDEISQYYDPMIAKLIVYAEDRPSAIARLQQALAHSAIFGVQTNIPLLHAISIHPAFQAGQTHTAFLQENTLQTPPAYLNEALMAAACYQTQARTLYTQTGPNQGFTAGKNTHNAWQQLGPWRMIGTAYTYVYTLHEQEYTVVLRKLQSAEATWQVQIDKQDPVQATYQPINDTLILLKRGAEQLPIYIQQDKKAIQIFIQGQSYRLQRRQAADIETSIQGQAPGSAQKNLLSPMAGTIIKVQTHAGDIVEAHQVLMILGAMKMEHAITAPHAGSVQRVLYQEGDVVTGGTVVLEMD